MIAVNGTLTVLADRVEQHGARHVEQDRAVQEKLIVRIADRPDLVPIVAGWLWHEWWHQDGYTLEETLDAVAASVSPSGPPQSFVLLVDGKPIGTASLVANDLDERPDLTPWLAGVFVIPEARGRCWPGWIAHGHLASDWGGRGRHRSRSIVSDRHWTRAVVCARRRDY